MYEILINPPLKYILFTQRTCVIVDILGSIVVSIPACHAGDRGSIPRRGEAYPFCV